MKKMIAVVLCALMVLSLVACSAKTPSSGEANAQIANPLVDCESMDDASKVAGFTITIPEALPLDYVQKSIAAIENDLVQVYFANGDKEILIRKAKGNEDISGDSNTYAENNTITIGNLKVLTKGDGGRIKVATWVDGEFSYSIGIYNDETGLDVTAISNMVGSVH